jgi:polyferredoxin
MKNLKTAQISQLIFLIIFIVLFLNTEYRGSDQLSFAVNGFFRANPLIAIATILAEKTYIPLLLPGIILLGLSFLLGRFYCGWLCPLGTILDLITVKIKKSTPLKCLKGNCKYWILLPVLAASLFNLNIVGLLDPIAILVRALTFFLHPLIGETFRSGWVGLLKIFGDSRDYLDPGFRLIKNYILPFRESLYPLTFLSALVFMMIIYLERFERRNWCRNLCPLGTLMGIAAKFSLFKRVPVKLCSDCNRCKEICPTSFDQAIFNQEECILCMNCQKQCTHNRAEFQVAMSNQNDGKRHIERRVLLASIIGGFFLSRSFRFSEPASEARLLRPPGVRSEVEFLRKCVRCGECMKVCLRNALYPAFTEGGLEGIYTPVFKPRLGYCEYNCTLCGQVCPTGAIPDLAQSRKKLEVIGKAVFNKNHCIPFAKRTDCIVCEEHCPIPSKAIRSEEMLITGTDGIQKIVKLPYVVEELCNGCGICENVCPLESMAGVEIFAGKNRKPLSGVENLIINDVTSPYR